MGLLGKEVVLEGKMLILAYSGIGKNDESYLIGSWTHGMGTQCALSLVELTVGT